MRTGEIVISVAVALLGVASAVLGFIAEATKLSPDDINVSRGGCVYPATPAFPLALCAVLLLAMATLIASFAGGCCGCCRRHTGASRSRRLIGILASVLSWIAALTAASFFLQGAAWNAPATRDAANGCYFLKSGVFTRAAVLSLVAAALGIVSYLMLTRPAPATMMAAGGGPKPGGPYPPASVGMPQWPAQGQGQQGYGQAAQPYPAPAQQGYGQAAPHQQQFAQAPNYPPSAAAQEYGQAPNPQFAPPPGQGHAHV
ncbi:hypothetical protein EJB05_35664 [Eragrostis curvula]|uniref:Uncharacterized protein n=1 Tax=Eragrostis curvula TaxID=38414 RepID=A0A5J9U7D7_9POAL|nr:hypothetical protein EJB05_35664 [Eragrostis curvula]